MLSWLTVVAESLLIVALLASPWPFGSATDPARFSLTSICLLASGLWLVGRAVRGEASGVPKEALAVIGVGALQVVVGASVAPIGTAEALLVAAANLAALSFWLERARERHAGGRLAAAVLLTCAAQAVFGAVQWSAAPTRIYGRSHDSITMPFGSFVNHNHFAGLIEMGALLALGLAIGHVRRARQITAPSLVWAGLSFGLAAVHAASRSRGGAVALAVGTLVCLGAFVFTRKAGRSRPLRSLAAIVVGAGLLVGFALLAVSPSARSHLATILSGSSGPSGGYRRSIAAATLRLFAARPLLGAGFGAYEDAVPAFKTAHGDVRTTHAESDVLEVLAEGGLVGLAALTWLALVLARGIAAHILRAPDPLRKGMAIGAMSAAAALLVHSLVDFNVRIPSNALVLASLLGLAAAAPVKPSASSGRATYASLAVPVALLLLSAAAAWRAHGAVALERAIALADPNRRIERLDAVLDLHPYLAEAWRARGLAWRQLGTPPSAMQPLRLQRALHDFERAVALRPLWAEAWVDKGWLKAMQGDLASAEHDLAEGARLDPTHMGIRLVRDEFQRRIQPPPPAKR